MIYNLIDGKSSIFKNTFYKKTHAKLIKKTILSQTINKLSQQILFKVIKDKVYKLMAVSKFFLKSLFDLKDNKPLRILF